MAELKDYSAASLLEKERASNQVELDTDDVKEESISVEEISNKDESPNLNLGEVDLGYTDHSKPSEDKKTPDIEISDDKPEEVAKEEKGDDVGNKEEKPNLNESRKDYQKRIDKLVFQKREAERREEAALDYAKGIQKKFDSSLQKFKSTDEQYLKELDARVDAQREQVKAALQQAIEAQDASKMMEANDKLTQLAVEKEKARLELANREEQKKEEELNKQTNVQAQTSNTTETSQSTPQITPKAKKWAEENTWFGNDEVMTNAAITIHNNISQEGIEVDSDAYYNEVNSRLKRYFPESFDNANDEPKKEAAKPVQTVASASRSQQGRRTVKLTKSQVAIAKRLGVPLEEYARYVKEDK
mgnify:CR=1 FL=1|jgi:hypothetical protein|tara:strand:+ start:801 stop:1877 length:1077 start_codon:yes stop_codon:yes gene_type:complete